jgi:release factor glutamine methyltransferase
VTAREALREAEERLAAAGVDTPRVDAELLLAHVLGTTRSGVYERLDAEVDHGWEELVRRREAREPLAYIVGEWGFRRLRLKVDPRVLVPRPETEIVVERCLVHLRALDEPRVLDVGTGSGAIALAIADEHAGARVTAIDSSPDALDVARENAQRAGLEIELFEHDLKEGLPLGAFDLVVSNPPYVLPGEILELEPEVRHWEPRSALVGQGIAEQVAAAARSALRPEGWLVLETAAGTTERLKERIELLGFGFVTATPDLAGIDRVVEGRWL